MAISITTTGLTAQQQIDVGDAFDQAYPGRTAAGLTRAQWVERCLIRHLKNVVKGRLRLNNETTLAAAQAAVDAEYLET